MTIKLYYAPGACSFASHIALEEAGLDYETQRINTSAGEQRSPEYLKINPRGRVPTPVVDGNVLTENVGILTYIAGGYPRAGLWPRDTWHQAKAVSTMAPRYCPSRKSRRGRSSRPAGERPMPRAICS